MKVSTDSSISASLLAVFFQIVAISQVHIFIVYWIHTQQIEKRRVVRASMHESLV